MSRAFVSDLDNDVLDIGPAAFPMEDTRSHVERRVGGRVVFLRRGGEEKRKRKVC
jgi:hypothetical protein